MKKDNKLVKFTAFVLLVSIIALILVSGTYAKYTSSVTGKDTATVAKWSFKVGGTEIAGKTTADEVAFDIFSTITETDGTTAETDVSKTDGTLIAPGTMGSFKIAVQNNSEVDAKYKVDYSIENASNIPLEFSTDKATWSETIGDINQDFTDIAKDGGTGETTTVYWRWAFESGDDATGKEQRDTDDTTLGTAGTAQAVVKATITAVQVD